MFVVYLKVASIEIWFFSMLSKGLLCSFEGVYLRIGQGVSKKMTLCGGSYCVDDY